MIEKMGDKATAVSTMNQAKVPTIPGSGGIVELEEDALKKRISKFSKGMRQKVGIAIAMAKNAKALLLDEPTSGLDVSVQATILKLFSDLREKFDLTYIFISHDLSVVKMFCNRVAVMYFGKVVEVNDTKKLFEKPQHPYTKNLLSSIPNIGGKRVIETFTPMGAPPDQVEYLTKG